MFLVLSWRKRTVGGSRKQRCFEPQPADLGYVERDPFDGLKLSESFDHSIDDEIAVSDPPISPPLLLLLHPGVNFGRDVGDFIISLIRWTVAFIVVVNVVVIFVAVVVVVVVVAVFVPATLP